MIYADKDTRVIVCGATGNQGSFHINRMNQYARSVGGKGVVAGVTPGKGGQVVSGVPLYDAICEAAEEHDATAAVLFVPASAAADRSWKQQMLGLTLLLLLLSTYQCMMSCGQFRMQRYVTVRS
jgi:succinyl-CoA synthetase alpha subunit